ncbi:MAG: hypothetical protein GXO21_05390 [Aquificae bacterium]|nr:hypothetical protein [Aquificota bacterium]
MIGSSKGENKIIGNLGTKGEGKTTLLKLLLCREILRGKRVKVFFPFDYIYSEYNYYKEISENFEDDIDVLGQLIKRDVKEGVVDIIAIDELDMIKFDRNMDFLFRFSRNYNVDILYTAKRTANISKLVVSQTDELNLFKHRELNDLKRIKEINSEAEKIVRKLNKFEFLKVKDFNLDGIYRIEVNFENLEDCLKKYFEG